MLTAKKVERAKPGRYRDGEVKGLYLQVRSAKNKSWLLRYERDGIERWHGLGPADTFSLKEARLRARAARQLPLDGVDPIEHRKAQRAASAAAKAKALTFREGAALPGSAREQVEEPQTSPAMGEHAQVLRLSCARQYGRGQHRHPDGAEGGRADLAREDRDRIPSARWIESVLDWARCAASARATTRPGGRDISPRRYQGAAKWQRSSTTPPCPIVSAGAHAGAAPTQGTAARALEFTILTAARTGEVIGARWEEIDLDSMMWTVPAGRMKGGKEHRVPLSDTRSHCCGSCPPKTATRMCSLARARALGSQHGDDLGAAAHGPRRCHVHGMRSTFRDWAAEQTAFPNHVVKWRWLTSSATRSKPPIGAETCSPSANNLQRLGLGTAPRRR